MCIPIITPASGGGIGTFCCVMLYCNAIIGIAIPGYKYFFMNSELIFLGTSHIDPEGYERLHAFLQRIKPQIIILEVSGFAILFRKTIGALYRKILLKRVKRYNLSMNAEIENAIRFFDIPYEYRASKRYARTHGARVILADISLLSFIRLVPSYQLMRKKNIRSLSEPRENRFVVERKIAERVFTDGDPLIRIKASGFTGDRLLMIREKILLRRIHKIISRYRSRKIAYIGGWEHLIDDPEKRTLYSNLNLPKKREVIFLR
jgi:hypothetical protein